MSTRIEITVISGVSSGDIFRFDLAVDRDIKIGRTEGNDITLSDPRVSRWHAAVRGKPDGLYIHDLSSAAGTLHMGFSVKPGPEGERKLASGDEFKVGDTLFRISFTEEEQAAVGEKTFGTAVAEGGETSLKLLLQRQSENGRTGHCSAARRRLASLANRKESNAAETAFESSARPAGVSAAWILAGNRKNQETA